MYVYVCGSSKQLDRARWAMDELRARGHEVTHDWVSLVEEVGQANPPGAEDRLRRHWAREDLRGVDAADVLWVLMPDEHASFGAGVEVGFALARGVQIVCSGSTEKSIFTSLGYCYDLDTEALATFPDKRPHSDAAMVCDCRACESVRVETTMALGEN